MFFSSAVVAQSHYVGKIHAKKLKLAPAEHAIACSPMEPSGPQTKESECGELVAETVPSNPPEPVSEKPNQPDVNIGFPSLSDNVNDFSDPNKDCKLCGAQFNNPLMAKQHYSGKRHTRNEARKRLMVEMGEDVGPSDSSTSVGLGTYICPVCSVTFSSIEMYQSHMQGNKHQIKENFVVKLMKNTPKTYENFQDELADYIKVQKARGLEPNTTLRKTEECYERCKYDDKKDSSPPKGFTLQRRAPLENPRSFSRDCSWGSRSRSPYRSPSQRNFIRGRYTQTSQYHMKSYPKHQDIKETSFKVKVDGLSSVDSSKDLRHDSSDSSDSDHKERRQKRKHQKIKRHKGSQELKKDEHVEKKTKKSSEDTDSEKDNLNLEHKKEDLDTTNEEIVKHRKEKKSKADQSADKQGKKHKRDKKKKDIDPRTEEEKLWDESILGF